MAILTYEELFNFTKEFSKAFEALLSSNMRDWSTVNSITVRGDNNEILVSCYFRTIEYIDRERFYSNKILSHGRRYSASERELFYSNIDPSQANNFRVAKNRNPPQVETTERYIFDSTAMAFAVASASTGSREPPLSAQEMYRQYAMHRDRNPMLTPRITITPDSDEERRRRLQSLLRRLPSSN